MTIEGKLSAPGRMLCLAWMCCAHLSNMQLAMPFRTLERVRQVELAKCVIELNAYVEG